MLTVPRHAGKHEVFPSSQPSCSQVRLRRRPTVPQTHLDRSWEQRHPQPRRMWLMRPGSPVVCGDKQHLPATSCIRVISKTLRIPLTTGHTCPGQRGELGTGPPARRPSEKQHAHGGKYSGILSTVQKKSTNVFGGVERSNTDGWTTGQTD